MKLPYTASISPLPECQSLHHIFELICIQKNTHWESIVWVTMLHGRNVQPLPSMSSQSSREFTLQHRNFDLEAVINS